MTEEIIWKDPPEPSHAGRSDQVWVHLLLPLMEHPKRWAMVKVISSPATANRLRSRKYAMPEGEWEFRTHQIDMRHFELYARYLGPTEKQEDGGFGPLKFTDAPPINLTSDESGEGE